MAVVKLFSGMDFSGKSTTIKSINELMPGIFKCQQKFLTPIQTLQQMIDNGIWIPRDEFIPVLKEMVRKDLNDYEENALILQDTLWLIKFTSRLLVDGGNDYAKEINEFISMIRCYPEMDSFYITASMEERKKRYEKRNQDGGRISRSDKLLFFEKEFEEVDKYYQEIVCKCFPNTQVIDTTYENTEKIVGNLMKNSSFMSCMKEVKVV